MQKWQEDRNYRKYLGEDGTAFYVITIDGEDVPVSAEIYAAYSQADRRERYQAERDAGMLLSLERMEEDGVPFSGQADQHIESAEETAVRRMITSEALAALSQFPPDERRLIEAVVMGGVTEQAYADRLGVSQVAVHRRKKRILKKIFSILGY